MNLDEELDRYTVVWETPSTDSSGSMPLGNGDLGANVWVEASTGNLLLLIGKTDAWDENCRLCKLARVRLSFSPNPFLADAPFRQSLKLRTGEVEIVAGATTLRLWVDANHPIIRIECESEQRLSLAASVEIWRTEPRQVKTETGDLFKRLGAPDPHPTIVSPDAVLPTRGDNRIIWCHHNERREHDGFEINMCLQGLGGFLDRMRHPLLARTFGACIEGDGLVATDELTLKSSQPRPQYRLSIYTLTRHPSSIDEWRQRLDEIVAADKALEPLNARRAHEEWWHDFWNRSWLFVRGDPPCAAAEDVTRGYLLQRFMNAAAGRGGQGGQGRQPIKFNGSIFTVGKPDDPDYRRWGGPGFWFQNMRLIYWPMLASGDFDLMRPWLKMYLDMLPLQRHRTRTFFNHGGAHFPETIMFWGAEVSAHYGWTPFEDRMRATPPHPEAECSYVTYYWTCGLELSLILWTYYTYTLDDSFAREYLVPIADAVTEFFDVHYPRDASGKMRIEPSQALETWQDATNPTPEIAGMRYLLPKLLDLPESMTSDAMRSRWQRMLDDLPPLPIGDVGAPSTSPSSAVGARPASPTVAADSAVNAAGKAGDAGVAPAASARKARRVILPAERFDKLKNKENPELYAVFPFRLFGVRDPSVGKDDLQLARNTFAARLHRSHNCWSQDDIQAAMLGLTDEAKESVSKRAAHASHSMSRFPAFWDSFNDYLPDMDHGGVLQMALQSMLMQCEGRQIILLPAWPTEWDVQFKLHAPDQTTVEGTVRAGRIESLRVMPEARRADVHDGARHW